MPTSSLKHIPHRAIWADVGIGPYEKKMSDRGCRGGSLTLPRAGEYPAPTKKSENSPKGILRGAVFYRISMTSR